MDNANGFLMLPSPTVHPSKPISGDVSDQPDVIGRLRQDVEILRAPDFGVGQYAVPQKEPPGSPSFAVIGPLVEDAGDRALGSSRIAVRSAGNRHQTRRQAPGPRQRGRCGLRRSVPKTAAWTLQRDTAERVQFFHSHFFFCKNATNPPFKSNFPLQKTKEKPGVKCSLRAS